MVDPRLQAVDRQGHKLPIGGGGVMGGGSNDIGKGVSESGGVAMGTSMLENQSQKKFCNVLF